ncbi:MAG: YbdD/YjiX family protein [Thiothrix sp.]|jgi:uncharacterized short protein YbdD (DUF466 family)|uniref:YbdD/YjiX family protein n=1 Tax=Thiothrix sp. TaxID=1032 RepID=UPI002621DA8A|nr:YbdD/YjiX family protein [Thiothrix sp.]MDD5392074.1 YbdD/YjiX family protein [Thiothrix sp.]
MLSKAQWGFVLKRLWRYIRHASGDDAYERYLRHCEVYHPDDEPLARKAYFKQQQRRKWEGIRRCC